jgi:hypothetical protein
VRLNANVAAIDSLCDNFCLFEFSSVVTP